ncbi:hypothetical protein BaRGS_00019050 [Batillaria attramentaria]|uniref:Uncharacterized protein n=1 Tax=Batillaria attramentaria TaxID=370345 RepID=A0ABD0KSB1_9CAEN
MTCWDMTTTAVTMTSEWKYPVSCARLTVTPTHHTQRARSACVPSCKTARLNALSDEGLCRIPNIISEVSIWMMMVMTGSTCRPHTGGRWGATPTNPTLAAVRPRGEGIAEKPTGRGARAAPSAVDPRLGTDGGRLVARTEPPGCVPGPQN